MNGFLIAHLLSGDAADYLRALSDAIAEKRKLISPTERIDPHLTLKAPWNAEDTSAIEPILEAFAAKEKPQPFTLGGFDQFRGKVIYMKASAPKQTYMMIRRLQDQLRAVPYLTFKKTEFPITLHATICYPKTPESAQEILHELRKQETTFDCSLDTITLLQKQTRWEPLREYELS
jgi:2'-5' RNA ligase